MMKMSALPWLAAVSAALILSGCSGAEQERGGEAVTVVAQPPQQLEEQLRVEAVGTARAVTTASLYPETAGMVRAVRFSAGDFVRAGQVLVELDSRREQLAVQLAEVRVREASQLLDRYRRIQDTGAISESQIEAGETALVSARLELEQARTALADRTVRAPFAGHIGLTSVGVGDRIGPDTLIAQLDQRRTLHVDFAAPEGAFARLRAGASVLVSPFSEPEREITARVQAVDSTIAAQQRTYTVRTLVDNADDRLRPGMSFRVQFTDGGALRPAVPEEAIVWGGEGSYIWIVEEGAARRIPVTITSRRDGQALLEAPINPQTLVIVQGVQKVRDGQEVRLVEPFRAEPREIERAAASAGTAP